MNPIADLRRKNGLTVREMATRCGLHYSKISRLERGQHEPTVRQLQEIAKAFRIKEWWKLYHH